MKDNGLDLHTIKSKLEPYSNIDNLEEPLSRISDQSFIVAYLDYKVLIGTYEDSRFYFYNNETFDNKYIQRLRVFNNDQELLVWRSHDGLNGRLRTDSDGDSTEVVDAHQVLFGTKSKPEPSDNSYTKIFEDRGTELILPFKELDVDEKKNRITIKTRNYISYNEVHQATYVDCRFVEFSPTENIFKDKEAI